LIKGIQKAKINLWFHKTQKKRGWLSTPPKLYQGKTELNACALSLRSVFLMLALQIGKHSLNPFAKVLQFSVYLIN
jgi:hypothetical protein